ncbi:MAG: hypothetical protein C0399_05910 [Syntrophus sp. (in: bacteria)]|nr:hypothetical protein [Syntrophus sp. (in: bacteria)]
MDQMTGGHTKRIIFFSSLTILAFEIILIRTFSVRFSYHYASLIISIAMTGIVFGGIAAFLKRDMLSRIGIERCAVVLSFSCPLIFILSSFIPMDYYRMLWENIQICYLLLFMLVCSIPFFVYAIILSLSLSSHPSDSNRIYAADLIGASVGVALTVLSMDYMAPDYIIAIPFVLLTVVLLFELRGRLLKTVFLAAALSLAALIVSGQFTANLSPYKGLMQALKEDNSRRIKTIYSSHSRLDIFENPRMKFAPGLSLTYTKPVPPGLGIALDGEIAGVMLDENNIGNNEFLLYMPSAAPYLLKMPEKVMIIGFKNSVDVLVPYYFGAKTVYQAEKDRSVIKFLFSQYPGGSIYNKSLHESSGRLLLKKLKQRFDVISLSRTGFFPSGTFGLQEDYELTIEALQTYLSHLKEDGLLYIQMFLLPPARYELKMMNNIICALEKEDLKVSKNNLLIFRSWDTINFLIKKNGFSLQELNKINMFLDSRNFDTVYGDARSGMKFITGTDYGYMFEQLLDENKKVSFIKNYTFDIAATSDNRPFFHYFFKIDKLQEIYHLSGKKWSYFIHEGMALPFIIIFQVLISLLTFACFFIVLKLSKNKSSHNNPLAFASTFNLLYFIFIGFAFMFTEMFFVHRLMLTYGSPVSAFSITLVTLLLSSGAGSFVCGYLNNKSAMKIMSGAPLIALLYFFIAATLPDAINGFYYIIPLGFFLGFFFPMGIRIFCADNKNTIPIFYALNGAASIVAPLLASIIGVACGLRVLLTLAFSLYGMALFFLCFAGHGHKPHAP